VTNEPISLMLIDTCRELVEMAKAARAEANQSGTDYDKGRSFAFYEALSLLEQQANAFSIDRSSIGLSNFNAERDLLGSDR